MRIFLLLVSIIFNIILSHELYKAKVINNVFYVYFRDVRGIELDLDLIYKDGKKWLEGTIEHDEAVLEYMNGQIRGCN